MAVGTVGNSLPGSGALGSVDNQASSQSLGDFKAFNQAEQQLNHASNQLNFDKKAIDDDKWQ
jgi:hypothetical protein